MKVFLNVAPNPNPLLMVMGKIEKFAKYPLLYTKQKGFSQEVSFNTCHVWVKCVKHFWHFWGKSNQIIQKNRPDSQQCRKQLKNGISSWITQSGLFLSFFWENIIAVKQIELSKLIFYYLYEMWNIDITSNLAVTKWILLNFFHIFNDVTFIIINSKDEHKRNLSQLSLLNQ